MTLPQEHKEYIEVAIPLPVHNTYHYAVDTRHFPGELTGKRVIAPFGQRRVTGYVLGPCSITEPKAIKSILDVLDEHPLFPASMIPFFRWIADYYIHPIGNVIKGAMPQGLNQKDFLTVAITAEGEKALERTRHPLTPVEKEILNRLDAVPCQLKMLSHKTQIDFPVSLIRSMEREGWIMVRREMKAGRTKPKMERYVSVLDGDIPLDNRSKTKRKIMDILKDQGEIPVKRLKAILPTAPGLLKSMARIGLLTLSEKRVYRDPFGESITEDQAPRLTEEQAAVVDTIEASIGKGFKTYLLAGVTGSGKTEVYMQLAEKTIRRGKSVLVLVPEIALISQIEKRFRARFGECVALLHSGLSTGERYDQWMRIVNREVTIAIGARSAIFAPFDNIGLLIVDEEHDGSYKQEGHLRYNARDLAAVRARHDNSIALMGSATPSIQSYYNATAKKYHTVRLTQRVENRSLPEIKVVDLRKSRDTRGVERFITPVLYREMKTVLGRKEQVLLFLNRRGFAGYPVCTACGEAIKCKNCDISLTLHQTANAYKCHYCGFTLASTSPCRSCGSTKIRLLGLGTEKVEAAVRRLFPEARVARMDRDTTTRKGSLVNILKALSNGTIDILIGTQMVAKGHDFPNITLVGILCADLSLNFPDFRSAERTFQLLAQVSGRAGRGTVAGRVILQTYNPDHFSIVCATNQDFEAFYDAEIRFRKTLDYPPFSKMVLLKLSGRDREEVARQAHAVADLSLDLKGRHESLARYVDVLGPIEAPLPKIANRYRWQILLKGLRVGPLHRFVRKLMIENQSLLNKGSVRVTVDVDPFFMM